MTSTAEVRSDRRHVRRQETIEQVLDVAAEVMAEQGVAGLSLGEVARRMGIRTPSLYGYFDSKNALYDALFARGWQLLLATFDDVRPRIDETDDLVVIFRSRADLFVRWMVEHPAYAPLMVWRPVPGYVPSPTAYAPATVLLQRNIEEIASLQRRGLLRADVPAEELTSIWTALTAGVVSQQLSNAPDEPFDAGRFIALIPQLVDMFLLKYATSKEIR